jgi:opacity protein-like surface antigen
MRRSLAAWYAALGLIGLLSPALAADYEPPVLRGSEMFVPAFPTYFSWQGFYAGGQLSYSSAFTNFTSATQPQVAFLLRNTTILAQMLPDQWPVLGTVGANAGGFGGFLGYNVQYDNAIIGLELNYTRASVNSPAPDSPLTRRQTVGGLITDVTLDASGHVNITDFVTTRARFGWSIHNFMPYGTIGLAFGRADAAVSTVVTVVQTDPNFPNPAPPPATISKTFPPIVFSASQANSAVYLYGYSGGLGLDFALTQNIFARGEYEFIQWQRLWSITSSMHNFRAALAVKF